MNKREQELYRIFSQIEDPNEAKLFLRDILTDKEREEVSQRWALIKELAGGKSQREVKKSVGTSIATVTRGAQMLKRRSGGFEIMLAKDRSFSMEENLGKIRDEIDKIDYKVIDLLAERMKLMPDIARIKKGENKKLTQKKREDYIIRNRQSFAKKKGLDQKFIDSLYKTIILESKRIQSLEV